jgi:hypothetical protein
MKQRIRARCEAIPRAWQVVLVILFIVLVVAAELAFAALVAHHPLDGGVVLGVVP